jgi:hypothetical protein
LTAAVAHGLVATTLRDFARFAMLFTPSWHHAAYEQVVSAEVLKRIQTAGNSAAYKKSGTFHDHRQYFGEDPEHNSFQFDDVFADGALCKHGNLGQGIYVDAGRDVVGVYFSTNGYIAPYGEDKMPGFIRRAAKCWLAIRLDRTVFERFHIYSNIYFKNIKENKS